MKEQNRTEQNRTEQNRTEQNNFIKNFFYGWNWFEYLILAAAIILPLTLGLILDSFPLDIVTSILFPISILLLAKAKVEGYFLSLVAYALYIIVVVDARLFGEVITIATLSIPTSTAAIVTWLRNRRNDDKQGKVTKIQRTGWKEFTLLTVSQLVMGVGYYFLLRAFDTELLVLSTITLAVGLMGNWLYIRRSIWGPYVYLVYGFLVLTMWSIIVADGATYMAVIIAMQSIIIITDIYAMFNWRRLMKNQTKAVQDANSSGL